MRRVLASLVFALAAGTAAFAGAGLVVAPHIDAPGTPLFHNHVMAAYRLPIFLGVLRARFDPRQGIVTQTDQVVEAATMVLALLALLWPRLPRPTLIAVAELMPNRIRRALCQWPPIVGPPRRASTAS